MKYKSIVVCNLPSAGLGNKLLVWARAVAFARINNFPILVSPWYQLSIGPILRRERQTRFYFRQIKSQGLSNQLWRLYFLRYKNLIEEPPIEIIDEANSGQQTVYVFRQNPHWSDFFNDIKEYRDLLCGEFTQLVPDNHLQKVKMMDQPIISLHIRRGDFRELNSSEDFAKVGLVRTPLSYFIDIVQKIRKIIGFDVSVTVFSDGYPEELASVLQMPNVHFSAKNDPIVDMLLLAESKVIIFSAGSTFSQWAGFLSNAAIIHHPQHFHSYIRDESTNQLYFEGILPENVNEYPDLFIHNVKQIVKS